MNEDFAATTALRVHDWNTLMKLISANFSKR
jgi:hypothetical protein